MPVFPLLLTVFIVGQGDASVAPPIVRPPTTLPAGVTPGRPLQNPTAATSRATSTADQLAVEATSLPAHAQLTGQPMLLATAVAMVSGRPQQLEVVHTYWRLVRAVGIFDYRYQRESRLAALKARETETGRLRTAQAIAVARTREAELDVRTAQHDLAAALHLAESAPLPLPADRPLTEPYRTRYAELFSSQQPSDRVRMLNETLPLRQQAVESHAAAVVAAEEMVDAAIELLAGQSAPANGFAAGARASDQVSLATVLEALDAQVREQEAFAAAVCRYNDDIADYSLAVVPSQTSAEVLVSTLIKHARTAEQVAPSAGNVPASYVQPMVAPAVVAPRAAIVAPPAVIVAPPSAGNTVPSRAEVQPQTTAPPETPPNEEPPPPLTLPQESAVPLVPAKPSNGRPASNGTSSDSSAIRSTFKPIVDNRPADNSVQIQQLIAALYDSHEPATQAAAPLTLADCLRAVPPSRRMEAVEAYWTARQADALCQLHTDTFRALDELKPALAAEDPPAPIGMPGLRSARMAVAAQLADARADCLQAELTLAFVAGLPSNKLPPHPTSLPRATRLADSFPKIASRRLEEEISLRGQIVGDHAAALVAANSDHSVATTAFLHGQAGLDHALAAIDLQADESAAFLQSVKEYNRSIAQQVLAASSGNVGPEPLAAALTQGQ